MDWKVLSSPPRAGEYDTEAFFVQRDQQGNPALPGGPEGLRVQQAVDLGDFAGKEDEKLVLYDTVVGKRRRVVVIGLGDPPYDGETIRVAAGHLAGLTRKTRKLLIHLPEVGVAEAETAEAMVVGFLLGRYRFDRYRKEREEEPLELVALLGGKRQRAACTRGALDARCVAMARDMANEPANRWTPESFAERAQEIGGELGLKVTVYTNEELQDMGMGGLLAVNQGSARPARLVVIEYRTGRKAPTLVLVGKGLTFDSGGISLKPSAGMEEMKYDMCGAAAVLAAMYGIGVERPTGTDVVGVIPTTENMPGPGALKPGDIVTLYGGTTVEVANTDAEGRLILADALAWARERFAPAALIDIATLTGAVIVGLGHHYSGVMGTDDQLVERLIAAGDRVGEPMWRLPLGKPYRKQLESTVADIRNIGKKKDAGTITAGAFLQEFVGDTPWAHIDIAGTAWNFTEKSYVPAGPSGIGVRTFLALVRDWRR